MGLRGENMARVGRRWWWNSPIRECPFLVEISAKSQNPLAGEDAKDGSLVLGKFCISGSAKSHHEGGDLTSRRIAAVHLQVFSEEGLDARETEMGETGTRVQQSQDALQIG